MRVLRVRLEDVHPSLEVVDAFREVSGAFEEKNRLINEAEGYRNEQVALARGNAQGAAWQQAARVYARPHQPRRRATPPASTSAKPPIAPRPDPPKRACTWKPSSRFCPARRS